MLAVAAQKLSGNLIATWIQIVNCALDKSHLRDFLCMHVRTKVAIATTGNSHLKQLEHNSQERTLLASYSDPIQFI